MLLFGFLLVTQTPSAHAEAVATFQGLGDLPGGVFESAPRSVSSDGSTVVGHGIAASGYEAFRWTSGTGMVGLGDLPGGSIFSIAQGVSSDGSVVVGHGYSASGIEAFRWTIGTGMVGLGDLPGGSINSSAQGISSDGSVVVGRGYSASGIEAFRWTSGTGMVGLGDLPGGMFESIANGVSSDGSTVVGQGYSLLGPEAFRWTSGTGMVGLGFLSGGSAYSVANGVSSDGSTVVGQGYSASGPEAFRWTSGTGMVGLGFLPGGSIFSSAQGVSSDGSVVVGYSDSVSVPEAFLWTGDAGMQSLASVLSSYGVSTTGFAVITGAEDIAVRENTVTIVGHGSSSLGSQAFLSTLPIVSASLADELLSLTPGLTSDALALDVSATRLLYGNVGRYEFDFTTDGIYDLVLDVGTPLFNTYWDSLSESFLFSETDIRNYYAGINAGGFGSLSLTTTIRMTHENGTAINTSEAVITVVPEVGSLGLSVTACLFGTGIMAIRRRHRGELRQRSMAT
jgi:probable HAF family extracellular repeat protein